MDFTISYHADIAWMLTATCLVFFMTPGLAFFYGGMVNKKNIISTILQSFIALGLVSVLWVVLVFSLAFGDSIGGVIGDPRTFFMFQGVGAESHPDLSPGLPLILFAMFQLKFAIITPALISGAFAERINFNGYLIFVTLFSIFVYAPLAHMTWHPEGILRQWGILDYAGGTVVHMSAGIAALAGAISLGRRKSQDTENTINIPFVVLGTGMLWFGWFGFNAGSSFGANGEAAMALATTNTASATAMIVWILLDLLSGKKVSALNACIGAIIGLVAITPAAGLVSIGHSLIIGMAAPIICRTVMKYWHKSKIDDSLDVFPSHGVSGMFGMIATSVFAKEVGLVYGQYETFVKHLIALILVSLFVFAISFTLYKITNYITQLRVDVESEEFGLDQSQHNEQLI